MADVQLENGYTQIADALFEAILRTDMPGRQRDVVFALVRLTYGYHKTQDRISSGQIAELLGCDGGQVRRCIRSLVQRGIVLDFTPDAGVKRAHVIGIQKDFGQWGKRSTDPARHPDIASNSDNAVRPISDNPVRVSDLPVRDEHGPESPRLGPVSPQSRTGKSRTRKRERITKEKGTKPFPFPDPVPPDWIDDIESYLGANTDTPATVTRRKAEFVLRAAGESDKATTDHKTRHGWLMFVRRGIRLKYWLDGWSEFNSIHQLREQQEARLRTVPTESTPTLGFPAAKEL